MAIRLEEFQPFEIAHIPRKNNEEADFLSRLVATINLDYFTIRKEENPFEFVSDDLGRLRFVGDGKNRLAIPFVNTVKRSYMVSLHDDQCHMGIETCNRIVWHE